MSALPQPGSFVTAPAAAADRDVTLAWSADTVGQGWGINPEWGGLRLYETMRQVEPDIFIHLGDTIYADQPVLAEVKLDDGTVWKNVVTEAKSKAAETLDEFRGAYQYNLMDEHMRRFNSDVGQVVLWDDHEVRDNWYPTRDLTKDHEVHNGEEHGAARRRARDRRSSNTTPSRRTPTTASGSIERSASAPPSRSSRSTCAATAAPNSENRQATLAPDSALAGPAQLEWLKTRLAASQATWKVIASDLPIGVVVPDGRSTSRHSPTAKMPERADASWRWRTC